MVEGINGEMRSLRNFRRLSATLRGITASVSKTDLASSNTVRYNFVLQISDEHQNNFFSEHIDFVDKPKAETEPTVQKQNGAV